MKKFLVALGVCVLSFGLSIGDVEAKRLGGGKSTGMQRESVAQRPATPSQNVAPAPATPAAPTAATAPKRNWLGPLAGLAAGLGIAALLSHFGLGEGMANFLMVALLVFGAVLVFRLLFRSKTSAMTASPPLQYTGAGASGMPTPSDARQGFTTEPGYSGENTPALGSPAARTAATVPADFDVDAFLRVAKLNFIRLQAANDAGNLEDIREFVTPEMFAEIKLQLSERGGTTQQTDVVTLNAELLEVVSEATRHIASVRFSGMIREEVGAPATPLDEVWNLSKPLVGTQGWVVAGIQQLS